MTSETVLKEGDSLTLRDLITRAGEHKGLKMRQGSREPGTEPIKAYKLDDELIAFLAKQGIKRQLRPDCRDLFTLIDENPQGPRCPGWAASNYWNFKLKEDDGSSRDPILCLTVDFDLNTRKRGIVLRPEAPGNFVSPADHLPNLRMFKALVESDEDAPALARELAASDGGIVVTWTDIGLGGIRRLAKIFFEFARGKEEIENLGRRGTLFDPEPFPKYQGHYGELYVVEPAQPVLFEVWEKQLSDYRAKLAV